jgi:hypothetical protein
MNEAAQSGGSARILFQPLRRRQGCAALVVRTEAGWSPSFWDTPLAQAAATRGPGWLRVGPLARLGVARLWS